jgi:uncharacterized damage-inducible protein DinB
MEPTKRHHIITPLPECEPEIGRMLWEMEDMRRRTLRSIENMPPEALDALPEGATNTAGTLLYHIAEVEASWLYEDILEQPLPPDLAALFPFDHRDEQGFLARVRGFDLDSYLQRLEMVRRRLIAEYKAMSLDDFRKVHAQSGPTWSYDVTAEWALHHLMQHEAEHRGHIQMLLDAFKEGVK